MKHVIPFEIICAKALSLVILIQINIVSNFIYPEFRSKIFCFQA